MKKSILIACAILATVTLTSFGYLNWNHISVSRDGTLCTASAKHQVTILTRPAPLAPMELFYDLGSRFGRCITKEELNNARTVADLWSRTCNRSIVSYRSIEIVQLDDKYETVSSETGQNGILSIEQRKLIRSIPYSGNILVKAEYMEKNHDTGELTAGYSTPHLTVVPEKQAVCSLSKEELITYVKKSTQAFAAIVREGELQSGSVSFTITDEGALRHVELTATSGYPKFDDKMLSVITDLPGTWEPATNASGKKVAQKFVFSFGRTGC